jgi:multiple sugar transport system substrate-binding protein
MRKTVLLSLMLVMTILVVGCGAPATPAAPQGAAEQQPAQAETSGAKITFMTPPWGVPPKPEALEAFQKESGITVEVQSIPMDQLYSKVQVATAANQAPADVIFLTEEAPSFIVATGAVQPLNNLIENDPDINLDDFARTDFWTIDGNIYGLTTYVQLVMMDYNKARLGEAGYSEAPKTWAELREQALAVKAKGVDEYPIAMGAIDWSWFLMALSMGDPMFDDQLNPVFANEGSKAREALRTLLALYQKDKLITPSVLSDQTPHAIFMSGTGTFHQSWQGAYVLMNNPESSKQAPDVSYMILPEVGNTWSLDAAIGIATHSQNKDAAWKFIKWYVGGQNQIDIFNAYGLVPSRISVQEALNQEGKIAEFDKLVEQAKHVNQLPRYAKWWGPWTTKVTEQIRLGFQGQATSDQIIDTLAQEWNNLKAEYEQ